MSPRGFVKQKSYNTASNKTTAMRKSVWRNTPQTFLCSINGTSEISAILKAKWKHRGRHAESMAADRPTNRRALWRPPLSTGWPGLTSISGFQWTGIHFLFYSGLIFTFLRHPDILSMGWWEIASHTWTHTHTRTHPNILTQRHPNPLTFSWKFWLLPLCGSRFFRFTDKVARWYKEMDTKWPGTLTRVNKMMIKSHGNWPPMTFHLQS